MAGAFALALGLVAYNAAANRWPPFRAGAYVPANLVATAVVLAIGAVPLGLERRAVGLFATGAWPGVAVGGVVAGGLLVALAHPRARGLLADRRLDGMRGLAAAYYVLVRIPFGTVLLEEVAFRGVLFGALLARGTIAAIAWSSVAFGLWHVVPTIEAVRANRPEAGARAVVLAAAGGVVVTALGGVGFALLRERTGGIAAPFAAHALINCSSAAAALAAHRLRARSP